MASSASKRGSWWVTRQEAAELLQVSERTISEIRRDLPKGATRGVKAQLRFDAPMLVACWVQRKIDQVKPAAGDDDPLLGGPADSEGKQRYQLAMAQLREMDVAERSGSIVRRVVIMQAIRVGLSAMRAAGERLIRQFGNDAGEIYNEGIESFETAAREYVNAHGHDTAVNAQG